MVAPGAKFVVNALPLGILAGARLPAGVGTAVLRVKVAKSAETTPGPDTPDAARGGPRGR